MRSGLPVALPGMRIGLLGGSFDPAHEGHVNITEAALQRFRLDRVWWLVTPGNPLKAHGPAPLRERIARAQKLLVDPHVVVTDIEARLQTRMTADTISALKHLYPGVHFVWLMGSDNLVQFHHWDRWREIADMVPIGVLARPGTRLAARNAVAAQVLRRWRLPVEKAGLLADSPTPAWVQVNLPMSKLSSTALRRAKGERR
ncbi:nicotinate-nucleotide adenylyltransferase [Paracoccus caeni]|uniref:Probable nicotinate-nucleotide adenylyltransferase n=1 Tax=Paracoccus caeni TaxID=657651 RepID=A0A934SJD5_9RHOB|nr:nicotinate-nucleotide adenylyltransferase [Paracoccus caeni]MBK4215518.1 nicotinate-nucleotide adenylyltransferase [Paracoccus caeni]